jgi:hypothetical protein
VESLQLQVFQPPFGVLKSGEIASHQRELGGMNDDPAIANTRLMPYMEHLVVHHIIQHIGRIPGESKILLMKMQSRAMIIAAQSAPRTRIRTMKFAVFSGCLRNTPIQPVETLIQIDISAAGASALQRPPAGATQSARPSCMSGLRMNFR